jgi:hypothetical protein
MGIATLFFVVAAGVGVLCVIGYRKTRQQLRLIELVPRCTVAELAERVPGEMVEISGTVMCASPLTAELSGQPCVYYRSVTERVYEAHTSKGSSSRRSEVVAQNEQRVPFELDDGSGRVAVNPFDAEIDARKLVDRFEPHAGSLATVTLGGVSIQFDTGGSRTLGYRKVEHAVLVGQPAYVLGVLQDDGSIGRPPEGSRLRRFLISSRSEEELARSLRHRSYLLLAGAATGLLVAGMLLVVLLASSILTAF